MKVINFFGKNAEKARAAYEEFREEGLVWDLGRGVTSVERTCSYGGDICLANFYDMGHAGFIFGDIAVIPEAATAGVRSVIIDNHKTFIEAASRGKEKNMNRRKSDVPKFLYFSVSAFLFILLTLVFNHGLVGELHKLYQENFTMFLVEIGLTITAFFGGFVSVRWFHKNYEVKRREK